MADPKTSILRGWEGVKFRFKVKALDPLTPDPPVRVHYMRLYMRTVYKRQVFFYTTHMYINNVVWYETRLPMHFPFSTLVTSE